MQAQNETVYKPSLSQESTILCTESWESDNGQWDPRSMV